MNKYLSKFSDFNSREEALLKKYLRSKKHKPKKRNKKIVLKKSVNYAKGLSYTEFLQTKYWSNTRRKILKRDGYRCVCCKSINQLQVHHLNYKHLGKEHMHLDDLTTVCRECHKIVHGII